MCRNIVVPYIVNLLGQIIGLLLARNFGGYTEVKCLWWKGCAPWTRYSASPCSCFGWLLCTAQWLYAWIPSHQWKILLILVHGKWTLYLVQTSCYHSFLWRWEIKYCLPTKNVIAISDCSHLLYGEPSSWALRKPRMWKHRYLPQTAEVHIKRVISMNPDSSIFPYLEKHQIP